jgi:hypothetical protein
MEKKDEHGISTTGKGMKKEIKKEKLINTAEGKTKSVEK